MNISYRNGEVHTDNWDGVQARAKSRFEPGKAYPLSEVEKIRADLRFIPSPTRDELFIKGRLD